MTSRPEGDVDGGCASWRREQCVHCSTAMALRMPFMRKEEEQEGGGGGRGGQGECLVPQSVADVYLLAGGVSVSSWKSLSSPVQRL